MRDKCAAQLEAEEKSTYGGQHQEKFKIRLKNLSKTNKYEKGGEAEMKVVARTGRRRGVREDSR
eukprot:6196182-Pleurochrysis_carterae.AAC.1